MPDQSEREKSDDQFGAASSHDSSGPSTYHHLTSPEPFLHIGGGGAGLKADDLEETRSFWEDRGLPVAGGTVLERSVYEEVAKWVVNPLPDADISAFASAFQPYAAGLLDQFPDQVLAFRSNALNESGASGIFASKFFVPTGNQNQDEERISLRALQVYASLFTAKATEFFRKHPGDKVMPLLVQTVEGQWLGDYFLPVMAGSGYTRYDGETLIRATLGLGTRAVDDEAPVFTGDLPSEQEIESMLYSCRWIDALNREGERKTIERPEELALLLSAQPIVELYHAIARGSAETGELYFEWSYGGTDTLRTRIIQSAPHTDTEFEALDHEVPGGQLFAQGSDIVNHGRKELTRVIEVMPGYWGDEVKSRLRQLNMDTRDYLLIVPQEATSSYTAATAGGFDIDSILRGTDDPRIQYHHFSNAPALLELTYDGAAVGVQGLGFSGGDHRNQGGKHFQAICDRDDILYLSAPFAEVGRRLPEQADEEYPEGVRVYNIGAVAINDKTRSGNERGTVYLLPEMRYEAPVFSVSQLDGYQEFFWMYAKDFENSHPDIANDLCGLCHTIPTLQDPGTPQDPLLPDQFAVRSAGYTGIADLITRVLDRDEVELAPDLVEYLEAFRDRVRELAATEDS